MAAKRKRIAWGRILLLIIAALVLVIIFGCRLKKVDIQGTSQVTDEEVRNILQYDRYGQNTLLFCLMNRHVDTSSDKRIGSIRVRMTGLQSAAVVVDEKNPVGCIQYSGLYEYFDENGTIIEEKSEHTGEVPVVSGLDVKGIKAGEVMQVSKNQKLSFSTVLTAASELNIRGVQADTMTVDDNAQVSITIGDVTVSLGGSAYMSEKISELSDLQDQLSGMAGVLHLENYDPSRDSIVFTKETEETESETETETESETEAESVSDESDQQSADEEDASYEGE
ncbi:MAG: cell division protein FtsQ/DivIB [Lachnospiraceae bacterium]|jgi:cell division protein FtsQ